MVQKNNGSKIVFFDIDSTLVSHVGKSHIPEQTVQALNGLRANGHTTAIATGRNLVMTLKTAAFFNIDMAVCNNGAHVVSIPDKRDMFSAWLNGTFVDVFRKEASSLSSMAYALDDEHIYTDWGWNFTDAIFDEESKPDTTRKFAALERAQSAYIFAKPSPSWLNAAGMYDGIDVLEEAGYTEFRPRGLSKWTGILLAAKERGFAAEDIITVGDGENDIEMVKNASVGIAVGSAQEPLKAVADLVTDEIDKGGILSAFRKLGMV